MYTKTKMLTNSIEINTGLDFIKVLIPEKYKVQLLRIEHKSTIRKIIKINFFDKITKDLNKLTLH
jgi:hypothetical protein